MSHLSRPHCILTGCALAYSEEGLYVWGDLHTIGDGVWCHNASGISGVPRVRLVAHLSSTTPIVMLAPAAVFFERAGVATFFRAQVKLNEAAQKRLEGDSYAEL